MGDHEDAKATFLLERQEEIQHVPPQRRAKGGEGLIEQQYRLVTHQRPGNGHALAFAARHFTGLPLVQSREPDTFQCGGNLVALRFIQIERRRNAERHIGPQVEVGEDIVILKDHAHRTCCRGNPRHVAAINANRTGERWLESGDQGEQCGLAAARRADDGHEAPLRHRQSEIHQQVFIAEGGVADVNHEIRSSGWQA
jgi:hypothetical protein